uniref:Uncharacterized protein n=1 Tax=Arundo donax TaxID=35708 RepID=A0A0A9B7Q7_ARUDO
MRACIALPHLFFLNFRNKTEISYCTFLSHIDES